ncbi:non-ribosomal peptide synthetase [Dactylosporangium aurantiacum]|uniref:Non-ribosomal peptide synthetase n=1 Tax=Dactylosporangium aurantiacum TaxID=35754 RepID=A0A9Q9IRT9_9ACTN|nr:non-ribosomal peptide synthetase/MFS transporter [Dactylosporangium aurantiacum]MDG6109855.1 amino acid adenylation domain-containing protein [Dactylosporangium aurantiacum]UWZ57838.1 non-ribosomal peptide synthetase [Dactylosporangium aurantiacum]
MTATPLRAELSDAKRALLERRLRRQAPAGPVVPRLGDDRPVPLSFAQERLWFLEQFAPGTGAASIPVVLRLHGTLDPAAMAGAFSGVVARHEPLRSRFTDPGDGRPVVHVDPPAPVAVEVVAATGEEHARRLVADHVAEPFDLAAGPLVRPVLIRLADDDHLLVVAVHHIVTDGWSMDVFADELAALYSGTPLPDPPVRYRDYAAWQRDRTTGPAKEADLAYWREALAGVEPLELPTDHPRPARQTFHGAEHTVALGGDLRDRLQALSLAHGATLSMTLLAAYQAVLGRAGGQTGFAVGVPVAGRAHPELERLVGMFVNTLTMRARLDGDPTFAELLERTRETCLDAYAHQELPFEQLVQDLDVPRDVRRPPLFQALFAMQNYAETTGRAFAGLRVGHWPAPVTATRFEVELYVKEAPDELWATFVYNTDLFAAGTAERLGRHLAALLHAVAADPRIRLSDVDLLAPGERDELLRPPRPVPLPAGATLPALIAATVAARPAAVAVTFDGRDLTYAELDARSAALAGHLRRLGVGRGDLVAVCAERSHELVVALLAVMRAGAAYVPLDPQYPAERLAFMLADAAAPVVLTQARLAGSLPPGGATVVVLDEPLPGGDAPEPDLDPPAPHDTAYVIYTSGSTGRPKGVPNTHRGIVNRLDWMQRQYRLGDDDVVLQKTPASFDVSVWEFFWPLLTGARLVLAAPGGHRDAEYLRDLIRAERVTTLHFVPSMLAVFLAADGVSGCTSLRRVICSGEELPVDLARRCLATLPAGLHNLYGPTEAAIDVSAWQCDGDALTGLARVPIGAPIQNIALYVLDDRLRPVPAGVPGQLFIAGVGLATGYLRRPALTAQRFLPDPYGPPGTRMYATGDLALRRPDGTIDFLGRMDTQVKLRGLRIELGEIEAALRDRPGVRDAAVVVREDSPGDKRLVAYLAAGDDLDEGALRTALRTRLPDYMVPAAVVVLPELPLTPNGKLDRRALPAPVVRRDAGTALVEPRTPTEHLVAGVWRDLLTVDALGIDDDFFDLGGHSLIATQVVARLRQATDGGVSVLDVFQHRTVRALAALLDTPAGARGPRRLLNELTRPVPAAQRVASLVCVPYGGGSAVVYQPLADALPAGWSLHAVAIPGQDIGLKEDALPFDELAARCTAEVLERVEGPLVVYGHCGVGSSLAVELARRLEAAGRTVDAVYIGAVFPFARPTGRVTGLLSRIAGREALLGNRVYENWLRSMGVDMAEFDRAEADTIIRNMREHTRLAEEYFTGLFAEVAAGRVTPLRAPIVSVVGSQDTQTEFYTERFREWHFLTGTTALVVLDEAGHFFLKYRATELAGIVTAVHGTGEPLRDPDGGWAVAGRSTAAEPATDPVGTGPEPSLGRFLAVAAGQLVSIVGSALTEFAIPLWIYLQTGSLVRFAVFAVLGLVPGMLVAPVAGAVVDRFDRRTVMLAGDIAAGASQAVLLGLALTGSLRVGHIYVLLVVLSVALTFQRLAFASAVPQLVPKRYLGHANGIVQLSFGAGQFLVPLAAAGLMATVGLRGVLLLDVASYAVAITVIVCVRFPKTLAWARRETFWQEVVGGWRYSLGEGGLRPVLVFFAVLNLFMTPLFLLLSPLVLSFADLDAVARVSMAGGLGAILGGLLMSFWGGPRQRRVRGMLLVVLLLAGCSALPGLRASELLVAAGALGMSFGLTLTNGVYTTIVQVKVPQRYHGRVFAVNTVIAFSTIPIGYAVVGPLGSRLLEPLMAPGGALSGSVGAVIGTGPGRGTALLFLLLAAVMAAQVLISLRLPSLAGFDERVPDATPDDLIGARARAAKGRATAAAVELKEHQA